MLAAVVAAAAAVGKVDQLYRHAVAATAALDLPVWPTQQGGIDGQAGYGCRTALALVHLYFNLGNNVHPNLFYLDVVRCGTATSSGCYSNNQIAIDQQFLGDVEVEHYLCLHEVIRPAVRHPARRQLIPPRPQLLHWQQFGESETQKSDARQAWISLHSSTDAPAINSGGHWEVTKTTTNEQLTSYGEHDSGTGPLFELMTPLIETNEDLTEVPGVYLSAATLEGCTPTNGGSKNWCVPNNEEFGCTTVGDVCQRPPEQHGNNDVPQTDILPGYCSAGVEHFETGGHAPESGTGGGGGGSSDGDGGGGGGGGSSDGLSPGAIAGIVVGAVVVVGGAVAVAAGSGVLAVPALVGREAEALLI